MLARLKSDRFLLLEEQDFINLGIPTEVRRAANDRLLVALALNPLKPIQMPDMSDAAWNYLWEVETCIKASRSHYRKLLKSCPHALAAIKKEQARTLFDPPLNTDEREAIRLVRFHQEMIVSYHETAGRLWQQMSDVERLWFKEKPPVTRWAPDFPLGADYPFNQWVPDEPPQRKKQFELLEWVISQVE